MTKMLTRTVAAIFSAALLVLLAGEIGAAQAHHSTTHSIGTKATSVDRWGATPQSGGTLIHIKDHLLTEREADFLAL